MNYVRKTYVEFLYPGLLCSESSVQEIKTRDVSRVKIPKNAFGFEFFDLLSVVVDVDGKKVELTSEKINISPRHYYGGRIYTVEELEREFPKDDILVGNIKNNGYEKAILCRTGNWQVFQKTDVFVEAV